MTYAIHSLNASSEPIRRFELVDSGVALRTGSTPEPCKVFSFGDYVAPMAQAPARHVGISELVAKWEGAPDRRAAIARARAWVADTFHAGDGITLRSLRLRKGLSQQQLAAVMGTSQPHIARIERGADNLNIDTCRRLARALDVDLNALDAALLQQQKNNDRKRTP